MSILPADVLQSLAQLLQGLQSSDNSVRSQAEESLSNDWVASRPEILLMGLAELLGSSQETIVRLSECGILEKIWLTCQYSASIVFCGPIQENLNTITER